MTKIEFTPSEDITPYELAKVFQLHGSGMTMRNLVKFIMKAGIERHYIIRGSSGKKTSVMDWFHEQGKRNENTRI